MGAAVRIALGAESSMLQVVGIDTAAGEAVEGPG